MIVDSLDEAQLRVGTENFIAFIENILSLTSSRRRDEATPPSLVLFARSDAAEVVQLAFAEREIPLARLQVDFFSYADACKFISAYLRNRFDATSGQRPDYNVELASPKPFAALRDRQLRQVARVVLGREPHDLATDWQDMHDFVGYAPVLTAIAETLAVSNPAAQQLDLQAEDSATLLITIVKSILARESGKVGESVAGTLRPRVPAISDAPITEDSLYTEAEQVTRLTARMSSCTIAVDLPATLPIEVREHYETSLQPFLPDHPFLRGKQYASVVFSDYVKAVAAVDQTVLGAVRELPHQHISHVGPFFAQFVHHLTSSCGSGVVPEALVEHLFVSWTQEAKLFNANEADCVISISNGVGHMLCTRTGVANLSPSNISKSQTLLFELVELTGALALSGPVEGTTVISDEGVIVGRRGEAFSVGPGVIFSCRELVCECDLLRVEGGRDSSGVTLHAGTIDAPYLKSVEGDRGSLQVVCSDIPPLLRPFRRAFSGHQGVSYDRYMDLRSVLTAFRGTSRGDLAVSSDKLEQVIVRDNGYRRKILDFLLQNNVIRQAGTQHLLSLNALGKFGFTLVDLKSGPNDNVLAFLVRHDLQLLV